MPVEIDMKEMTARFQHQVVKMAISETQRSRHDAVARAGVPVFVRWCSSMHSSDKWHRAIKEFEQ